jgi:hypothetical protein
MATFNNTGGTPANSFTYTNPSASTAVTVIGILVGNTSGTDETVTLAVAGNNVATGIPLPAGGLLELIQGKIVLGGSETIVVTASTGNIGVFFSVLEGV